MPRLLLSLPDDDAPAWRAALAQAAADAGMALDIADDAAPQRVDYIAFSPGGPVRDFRPFTALKALLSLWAGVERALPLPALPATPLCRMVDPGLRWGMTDYVAGHVLRYHLDLDAALRGPGAAWGAPCPPLARDRPVTVLGLGELGGDAATMLARLRFAVRGWSRTPKALAGVACHHGAEGLTAALTGAEIVVALLPATPQTENLLDARALAAVAPGARLINAGRGQTVDDAALLAALDSGQIGHATLDVFRAEPLPADHPYRRHPRVTVTPHIAAATRPETAAPEVIAQIARAEAGLPLLHVVDRARGY